MTFLCNLFRISRRKPRTIDELVLAIWFGELVRKEES